MIKQKYTGACRTIQDQMGPSVFIFDHMGSYRTIQGLMGPHRLVENHTEPNRNISDNTGPYSTIWLIFTRTVTPLEIFRWFPQIVYTLLACV